MIRYYLLMALRNLVVNRLYTSISIGGLAVAFATTALITIYINDELSYDKWLPDSERIFHLGALGANGRAGQTLPSDVGNWLNTDFPQIEAATRIMVSGGIIFNEDINFNESIFWADTNVFDVFSYPIVAGNLKSALTRPDTLVLTRSYAMKYFDRPDPIGEFLLLNGEKEMEVMAIIEDFPSNTNLKMNILAASHSLNSPLVLQDQNTIGIFGEKLWGTLTFFKVSLNTDVTTVIQGLPDMLDRHTPPDANTSDNYFLMVRSTQDLHLSKGIPNGPVTDLSRLYIVAAVAVLALLAGTINFVNLLTAIGMRRSVEVGIRKSNGAGRQDLFYQFICESFFYVTLAAIIGLALAEAFLPAFNGFLQREMGFTIFSEPYLFTATILFFIITGLLAGVYPAAVLSSFRPVLALQTRIIGGHVARVKQALVVLQFSILIGLLISTLVTYQQMEFATGEALQQNSDPIIVMNGQCSETFKYQVLATPGVIEVACSSGLPQLGMAVMSGISPRAGEGMGIRNLSIDAGFFKTYDLNPVAGRFFSEQFTTDFSPSENTWLTPEAVIINETAIKELAYDSAEDAIGQTVRFNHIFRSPATFTPDHEAVIIGVVENFQIASVREEIPAAIFYADRFQSAAVMSVKLDGQRIPEALEALDQMWEKAGDGSTLQRYFFEQSVQTLYLDIQRQIQLFSIFSGIAILIAILGLVGLAAHTAVTRTKEIGIRKALGESQYSIIGLLLWQFSKPVLLANALAWPLAYYSMNRWLQNFASRIDLDYWVFFSASLVTIIIAILAVFLHAY